MRETPSVDLQETISENTPTFSFDVVVFIDPSSPSEYSLKLVGGNASRPLGRDEISSLSREQLNIIEDDGEVTITKKYKDIADVKTSIIEDEDLSRLRICPSADDPLSGTKVSDRM